ncbi:hypothetical protein CDL15_Pgr002494 [Punica granatum]|uniref:PGG domain-containing protein n=1 Tax=Punica granatum TaxID=22663 RepID=A0A218XUL5_PUNGR|nr:hypothetical protein CDL15_Pgr002494 [Punica granatum]
MLERLRGFDFLSAYAMDRNGHSPLHAAALSGHRKITARTFWRQPHNMDTPYWSFLKKADSSPNQEDDGASEQTCTQRGQTLLMVAVLLTAVTFLAAFTMPGGYNNNLVQTKEWPFCSRAST